MARRIRIKRPKIRHWAILTRQPPTYTGYTHPYGVIPLESTNESYFRYVTSTIRHPTLGTLPYTNLNREEEAKYYDIYQGLVQQDYLELHQNHA